MSTEDQFKEFTTLPRKFGKICCFKTPTRQVLVVSDVPTYRSVMKRRPREFSAPDFENIMDSVNMAMSEGDVWKKHRRISSRPLMETNLDKLLPMISSTAQDLIRRLRESAGPEGRVVWRPVRDLQLCAARVASAVYMGEDDPIISEDPLYTDEMQDEIWSLICDSFVLTLYPTCVFYHDRFFYRLVFPGVRKKHCFHQLAQRWRRMESKIMDAIRRRARDGSVRPYVCKSLPDGAGREFSERELAHTFLMYIGGGAETTASAMSWLLSNLCVHPEIQQRARREADSIGELSVESIRSMPFIEACALETLRLNPPAPLSINRALVDSEVAGKEVKAGTRLIFPIGQMMRESYEEGEEFMPERWLTPSGDSIDEEKRLEFTAFGFGPRQCPGRHLAIRELLCNAALLLRNFDNFCLLDDQVVSPMFENALTTCPKNLVLTMRCRAL
ncbi:hypothetical protein FOZ63_024235 [Perkinsus olseni]|uniref:Cytochrome P450 n=1 Tax=Perkinsus olseni TaxID=32597 RepID=A0A7J6UI05_PEROL|nr:hypothetical protein FOZ62_024418 [Perkinsus olseni]KAF4756821.1 hypothetical protein FOZ63_024235 [Perkinsus olseni]